MITLVGLSIPALVAGNLLIEVLFNYPGARTAVLQRAAATRTTTSCSPTRCSARVLTVLGNLIADIAIAVADPRVRLD